MPDFVYDIPSNQLAVLFSVVAVGAVLFGLLVVKPVLRIFFGTGPDFNQNVSFGGAGFNLFYGLLLGLLTVSAYQNNERVQQAVLAEATAIGSLYAGMRSYPEPMQSDVQALLRDYTLFTIYADWEAHRTGHILDGGDHRAEAIRQRLASFEPRTDGQIVLHESMVGAYEDFTKARQGRLAGVITCFDLKVAHRQFQHGSVFAGTLQVQLTPGWCLGYHQGRGTRSGGTRSGPTRCDSARAENQEHRDESAQCVLGVHRSSCTFSACKSQIRPAISLSGPTESR